MRGEDLCYLTIREAADLVRLRQLSPVELVEAYLDRIGELDGSLHAFITVTATEAREAAREAERAIGRGEYLGPLHGIPYALKDLYATQGIRTSAHSRVLKDWIPQEDATVVKRLKEAGAVLLGKLSMHEFAHGGPPADACFPNARNPWDLERMPGGSSSGSAVAVAAGLCPLSLGTDTGGSIRMPAAICGVVGFKPTYGRVSRAGVVALSWSQDTMGPVARSVEDIALSMGVLAGHDPRDPASFIGPVPNFAAALRGGLSGLRLGIPRPYFFDPGQVDREIIQTVDEAVERLGHLGAELIDIELPFMEYTGALASVIGDSENHAYHRPNLLARPQDYGISVRNRFRLGALYRAGDYLLAQRVRASLAREMAATLQRVDALVTPTMPHVAPRFSDYTLRTGSRSNAFTRAFNLTGFPALTVPCGFTAEGLPVGMQIAGRAYDEATVLRVGYAYEQATPWHRRHPPLQWVAQR